MLVRRTRSVLPAERRPTGLSRFPAMRRFLIACAVGIPVFLGREDDSLPKGADAVVALSGSSGTLPAAQTLVGGGIAPTLVVSAKRNSTDKARNRLCRAKRD